MEKHRIQQYPVRKGGDCMITAAIPGGNIQLFGISGNRIELDVELRDTTTDWFYWSFKAEFPRPGRYEFYFVKPNRIGPRGPAYSLDGGRSWRWLGENTDGRSFVFDYDGSAPEVLFCMGMAYLERDFDAFRREFSGNALLQVETLCRSRQGRAVEIATIREGAPEFTLLLTSRHHAGEMMATYVLEGMLRYALIHEEFRRSIGITAVPFVDKDGVENGDQGKNRAPHDHARDYEGESIYPEVAAIRELFLQLRPAAVMDLHCPWLRGGCNEWIYVVGSEKPERELQMTRFGRILETETPPCCPYHERDNVRFGTLWNTAENYTGGWTIRHFAENYPFVKGAFSMEIPFANAREVTLDRAAALELGAAFCRAMARYLKEEAK